METKRPATHPVAAAAAAAAAARRNDSRLAHVHSTNRHDVETATEGQVEGPWKRYHLTVDDGRPTLPAKADDADGGVKRVTLDPATRAGCVPATAYPSFRTLPPRPATATNLRQKLPRVRNSRFLD